MTLTDEDRALIARLVKPYTAMHAMVVNHPEEVAALLSAARQARTQGPGEGSRATEALTWLSGRLELELSFGCVDGDPSEGAWIIHAVSGGVNDREWSEIAHGETVFEAIENARATYPAPPASQIKER